VKPERRTRLARIGQGVGRRVKAVVMVGFAACFALLTYGSYAESTGTAKASVSESAVHARR